MVWGGLHGLYQIIGDMLAPLRRKAVERTGTKTDCESYRLTQIAWTFCLTTFAWIFFRAETIEDAFLFIRRIGTRWNPWVLFNGSLYELGISRQQANVLLVALAVLLLADLIRERKKQRIDEFLSAQNLWFRWLVLIFMLVLVIVYGAYGQVYDAKQFIYFQF